jgi:hypothetical protein
MNKLRVILVVAILPVIGGATASSLLIWRAAELDRSLSVISGEHGDLTMFVLSEADMVNRSMDTVIKRGPYGTERLIDVLEREDTPILAAMTLAETGPAASKALPRLTVLAEQRVPSIIYSFRPLAWSGQQTTGGDLGGMNSSRRSNTSSLGAMEEIENASTLVSSRLQSHMMKGVAHAAIAGIGEDPNKHVAEAVLAIQEILRPISERQVGSGASFSLVIYGKGRFSFAIFMDPENQTKHSTGIDRRFEAMVNGALMVGDTLARIGSVGRSAVRLLAEAASEAKKKDSDASTFCAQVYDDIADWIGELEPEMNDQAR